MKKVGFITEDFLLHTATARDLYHNIAKAQPIFDYHSHLSVKDIAEDKNFDNLTQIWIEGDHYKWRAMRANGVDEKYITGSASDEEKFQQWALTVPALLRHPLYHWTHLELKNYFGIDDLLNGETAAHIYDQTSALLKKPEYSVRNLLYKMQVKVVGTTDDPTDDLRYHLALQKEKLNITIVPTFRADKAIEIEKAAAFMDWVGKLTQVSGVAVTGYFSFLHALQQRHDFFHANGCRISDHGIACFYAEAFTKKEIKTIFDKALQHVPLSKLEIAQFKSALILDLARMDAAKNWTQQFHVGAIRNNNTKMLNCIGVDAGYDSIGESIKVGPMALFFDALNSEGRLAKTIVYNLNPCDSEMTAAMVANFNDAGTAAKMQYGAAWWFLDQKDGIEKQLNVLSNFGLLSHFIGMVTDSRSFLSYSRHEYFRRILCNILGREIENGELPNDKLLIGQLIKDLCYANAKNYLNFPIHEKSR